MCLQVVIIASNPYDRQAIAGVANDMLCFKLCVLTACIIFQERAGTFACLTLTQSFRVLIVVIYCCVLQQNVVNLPHSALFKSIKDKMFFLPLPLE